MVTHGLPVFRSMEKRKATRKGGPIVRMLQGNRMKLLEKISGSPTWTRTRDLRINSTGHKTVYNKYVEEF